MCFCEMFRCLVGDCGVVGDLLGFWVVGARNRVFMYLVVRVRGFGSLWGCGFWFDVIV